MEDTGHRVSVEEEGNPDMVEVFEEGIGHWASVEEWVVNSDWVKFFEVVVEEAKVARIPYIVSPHNSSLPQPLPLQYFQLTCMFQLTLNFHCHPC